MLELRGLSQNEVSRRIGGSLGLVRDIVSGKVKSPRYESIESIAEVLAVSPEYLVGRIDDYHPPVRMIATRSLKVMSTLTAGSWHDTSLDAPSVLVDAVIDPRYADFPLFALHIGDESAARVCPRGGYIICVGYEDLKLTPHHGQYVVAEQSMPGTSLVERSVREYQLLSGKAVLAPITSLQRPLHLSDTVKAMALIIGSIWRPA